MARSLGASCPVPAADQHHLTSLADGVDVLKTGLNFEDTAANVAEYHDIPLATLDYFPLRSFRPAARSCTTVARAPRPPASAPESSR